MYVVAPCCMQLDSVASDQPRANSLGSGTLVSFGTLREVLTAAHVVDALRQAPEIGFVNFAKKAKQAQAIRMPGGSLESLEVGGRPWGALGPDLGFLRLPEQTADALATFCSYLNLPQQARLVATPPPNNTKHYDVVIGVVQEWIDDDPSKVLEKGIVNGLANSGSVAVVPAHSGFDRYEFTPGQAEIKLPSSYGGTSGGGLWRVYMEEPPGVEQKRVQTRLLGIPFYEIIVPGSSPNIVCHGPDSIYNSLMGRIRSRWPRETAGV